MQLVVSNPRNFARHQPHQLIERAIRRRDGEHPLAIAQHRDAIRDLEDFFQPMRDIEDADALLLDAGDQPEQRVGFTAGERSGRFVHDDQARFGPHDLDDLHDLLLGNVQIGAFLPVISFVSSFRYRVFTLSMSA